MQFIIENPTNEFKFNISLARALYLSFSVYIVRKKSNAEYSFLFCERFCDLRTIFLANEKLYSILNWNTLET